WMRRCDAELSKIVFGRDNSVTKMVLPDAVDHDARGQRVVFAGNPLGQLHPTASDGDSGLLVAGQQSRQMPGHLFPKLVILSTNLDLRIVEAGIHTLRRPAFLN